MRNDDLLDGGTLRMSDPLYALQPVAEIGSQYADRCTSIWPRVRPRKRPLWGHTPDGSGSVDVDDLLLQVMPDREKVGRLARLTGTLRYAIEGGETAWR